MLAFCNKVVRSIAKIWEWPHWGCLRGSLCKLISIHWAVHSPQCSAVVFTMKAANVEVVLVIVVTFLDLLPSTETSKESQFVQRSWLGLCKVTTNANTAETDLARAKVRWEGGRL